MFDILTIGTATHDTFLASMGIKVLRDPKHLEKLGFPTGEAECFADYSQWETWQRGQEMKAAARPVTTTTPRAAAAKKKLSYLEAREFAELEDRIADAEQLLRDRRAALEDPAIASDGPRLVAASAEVEEAETAVDQLYSRWAELEGL